MPDGDVHVKEHHSPCNPAESQAVTDCLTSDTCHLDSQAHLDIAIEEGASARQQKNLIHTPPAITPLGEPITLAHTEAPRSPISQADISPQLLPLRSVVILRI